MSKKNLLKNPLVWGIGMLTVVVLIVLVFAMQPTPEAEVVQVPIPVFVCQDDSLVQDPSLCPVETPQELITATPELCANLRGMFLGAAADLLGCPPIAPPTEQTCSLLDRVNPLSQCFIDGTPTVTCWDDSEVTDGSMCPAQPCSLLNPLTYGQCAQDAQGLTADSICVMSPDLAGFMGIMCSEAPAPPPPPEPVCQTWNPFTWNNCVGQLTESTACGIDSNLAQSLGYSCGYYGPPPPLSTPPSTPVPIYTAPTQADYSSGNGVLDWLYNSAGSATSTVSNWVAAPIDTIASTTSGVTTWVDNTASSITTPIADFSSSVATSAVDSWSNFTTGLTVLQDDVTNWFSGWW